MATRNALGYRRVSRCSPLLAVVFLRGRLSSTISRDASVAVSFQAFPAAIFFPVRLYRQPVDAKPLRFFEHLGAKFQVTSKASVFAALKRRTFSPKDPGSQIDKR